MLETFEVKTSKQVEFLDITSKVKEIVKRSGVYNGICIIFVPHTTAGVTINENADPDVTKDISSFMQKLIPQNYGFLHSEGNSDAHIKSSLFSPSLSIIVEEGCLLLGTWQGIYFCEFDGPRNRKFYVKVISG